MGSSLPTIIGSLVSILMLLTLAAFVFYRMKFVIERQGWTMVSTVHDHFYTSSNKFQAKDGFAVAFALWEPIDPKIGELVVVSDEWGLDENGESYWNVTKVETHICTLEELGLVEG